MQISRREFLGGMAAATLVRGPAVAAGPTWTDVHMHLIGGPQRQFDQAAERAMADMERRGITKAVVFPPPYPAPGSWLA